jgi:hypothetical protein
MGRRPLPPSKKKSRHVSVKMTDDEGRQLDDLVELPPHELAAFLPRPKIAPPPELVTSTQSSVIVLLIRWASKRLRIARTRARKREPVHRPSGRPSAASLERPPSTGRPLRTVDAAAMLGLDDPDRFLDLARRARVIGKRERHGHFYWSEADVQRVGDYLERTGK